MKYNPQRDEQGRVVRWYATGTDITERREAAEAVLASEKFARGQVDVLKSTLEALAMESSPDRLVPSSLLTKLTTSLSSESLTARELGVLALLARGNSNKEIATTLSISETTVKAHLRSIFAKLNVLSRTEEIATASRRGLVQV
jgi:two-component system NarL family response regulator